MNKVIYYLRPYLLGIIVVVGLHYARVNMDLALPDYMSKIVNIGIQQGGIEDELPVAISSNTYLNVIDVLDVSSKEVVERIYEPSDYTSELLEKFPKLEQYNALILNKDITIPNSVKLSFSRAISGNNTEFIKQGAMSAIRNEYIKLGADMVSIQGEYIIKTGGFMLIMTLLSAVCMIGVGYIAAKTAAGTAKRIRSSLFKKIESFSSAEFDKFSTASLITRSTNDINQIQQIIIMSLRMVIYAPLLGIGGFIRAMGKAPSMGWIIGLAVILLLLLIGLIIKVAMPKFKIIQSFTDRLNLVTRENLSGLLVVRAFNRQSFEEKRFDKANKDLTETNLYVMRVMVVAMPLIMLIMNGLSVGIVWVGSHQVATGAIQVGDMMAFLQYAMQIVMSFMMLSMMFITLPRAAVSAKRVAEVLGMESSVNDIKTPKNLPKDIKGEIEFNNVSFKYPGGEENAINNISFKAKAGQTTAIIGSTGSGKSTIVNLIPRFYDVTEGSITVDGIDIRELKQRELRSVIGLVPQKNVLFSGTIESNLKYGKKNADIEDLDTVVNIAQAKEFIEDREEGYESSISQNGSNVSGGQRQRLAISRALIKKAPLYVFDDSFSALDFKTDAKLRKSLKEKTGQSAIILVAQRVATIMGAEQIIVMDEGEIVGIGTHKELLENCVQYKEIAQSQLGLEEVL